MAGTRSDWPGLADVGEAYSGASAMLSSIALFGVAASLLMQRRQNRMTQLYSFKQQHLELVKLALDNPEFLYVDGAEAASDPENRLKVYANLLVSHWAMAWDLGMISIPTLRANAARLLRHRIARQWWQAWRFSYLTSKSRKRFVDIVDEEHGRATTTNRTATAANPSQDQHGPHPRTIPARTSVSRPEYRFIAGWALGLAVGVATTRYLSRTRIDHGRK
ncbi:DUF6082 family protein [Actinomycetes bacterium KLBMP 9797]